MRIQLLTDGEYERMADEVARVLETVGYLVDHPAVKEKALGAGCRESAKGRVLFSRGQVDELRMRLSRQASAGWMKTTEQKTQVVINFFVHPVLDIVTALG